MEHRRHCAGRSDSARWQWDPIVELRERPAVAVPVAQVSPGSGGLKRGIRRGPRCGFRRCRSTRVAARATSGVRAYALPGLGGQIPDDHPVVVPVRHHKLIGDNCQINWTRQPLDRLHLLVVRLCR